MTRYSWIWALICALGLAPAACVDIALPVSEKKAIEIAWDALEPNTSSHAFESWEVTEARQVTGEEVQDVVKRLGDRPAPGCSGPKPPANEEVSSTRTYWLIRMHPRPATPVPDKYPLGPTAPPNIPEPFVNLASFLIDAGRGDVVARQLYCLIY